MKTVATVGAIILVVAGGVGLFLMMVQRGAWIEQAKEDEALVHDLQNVRHLVTSLLLMREIRGRLPMKDGHLDLYSLKETGISPPITYEHFTSMRSEVNPSRSDVESGNYDHLPWERYSGGQPVDAIEDTPLIWEKRPDQQGRVIVGLLSGSVQVWDHADLRTVLDTQRAGPGGASAD